MAPKIKRLTDEERQFELKAYAYTDGLQEFFGKGIATPVKDTLEDAVASGTTKGVNRTTRGVLKTSPGVNETTGATLHNESSKIYFDEIGAQIEFDVSGTNNTVTNTTRDVLSTSPDVNETTISGSVNKELSDVSKTTYDVLNVPVENLPVVDQTTDVVFSTSLMNEPIVFDTTIHIGDDVPETTNAIDTVVNETMSVVSNSSYNVLSTTNVVLNTSTNNPYGVPQTTSKLGRVVSSTTEKAISDVEETTDVVKRTSRKRNIVVDETTCKPILGKTRDFYLIGFWYLLKNIFPDGYGTKSLSELASMLGIDRGNLHGVLKKAEEGGLIKSVPGKSGTYIEVLDSNVLLIGQQGAIEDEDLNNHQLLNFKDPDIFKKLERDKKVEAIFFSALACKKRPEELPKSAIIFLSTLEKEPGYIGAFVEKYFPRATSNPTAFFKTILEKEGDPLSQSEVERGNHIVEQCKALLNANPEQTGLDGVNRIGKTFNIYIGTKIEECQQLIEELQNRLQEFKK